MLADSSLHWIPCAYGPVPLRVTGDMISQPAHGTFGIVDMLPQHWPLPDPETMPADGEAGGAAPVRLREFVLFYQDGLNLRDSRSAMVWRRAGGNALRFQVGPPVPNCAVCDDSYDFGEQGGSYRSPGYVPRLRGMGAAGIARHYDMNARVFPPDFLVRTGDNGRMPLRLRACQGEQVVIRVVHPGGWRGSGPS